MPRGNPAHQADSAGTADRQTGARPRRGRPRTPGIHCRPPPPRGPVYTGGGRARAKPGATRRVRRPRGGRRSNRRRAPHSGASGGLGVRSGPHPADTRLRAPAAKEDAERARGPSPGPPAPGPGRQGSAQTGMPSSGALGTLGRKRKGFPGMRTFRHADQGRCPPGRQSTPCRRAASPSPRLDRTRPDRAGRRVCRNRCAAPWAAPPGSGGPDQAEAFAAPGLDGQRKGQRSPEPGAGLAGRVELQDCAGSARCREGSAKGSWMLRRRRIPARLFGPDLARATLPVPLCLFRPASLVPTPRRPLRPARPNRPDPPSLRCPGAPGTRRGHPAQPPRPGPSPGRLCPSRFACSGLLRLFRPRTARCGPPARSGPGRPYIARAAIPCATCRPAARPGNRWPPASGAGGRTRLKPPLAAEKASGTGGQRKGARPMAGPLEHMDSPCDPRRAVRPRREPRAPPERAWRSGPPPAGTQAGSGRPGRSR